MPPKVIRKTRGERVDDVLTKLKNRETVDEANLSRVSFIMLSSIYFSTLLEKD
jgi:hypothetical protein